MTGKQLIERLRVLAALPKGSEVLDEFHAYHFIWEAATEFVRKTHCATKSQSITTVADQSAYTLGADYMHLWFKNEGGEYIQHYNDGSETYELTLKSYAEELEDDDDTSVSVPGEFCIVDKSSLLDAISGSATSAGTESDGECTLTNSGETFVTKEAAAGDPVHNKSDKSFGVVLSVTSENAVVTALFEGGNDYWSSGDDYVVRPQMRYQVKLDPPPSTAGHTVTFYYIPRPAPVFSSYKIYREIPSAHVHILPYYAAWLLKYKDKEPSEVEYRKSDLFYLQFLDEIEKAKQSVDRMLGRPVRPFVKIPKIT